MRVSHTNIKHLYTLFYSPGYSRTHRTYEQMSEDIRFVFWCLEIELPEGDLVEFVVRMTRGYREMVEEERVVERRWMERVRKRRQRFVTRMHTTE